MLPTLSEIISEALHKRCVEPKQRLVGGSFGWAFHRFPIKGGIRRIDVIAANVTMNNALFKRLKNEANRPDSSRDNDNRGGARP